MTRKCHDLRLLFVYGTLMRGFDHPMARLLSANADFLGEARCQGRLYLVKHYPGLVLSDDSADVVYGELYRLRQPVELLREFDMYEACGEGFAEPTEYVRQMLKVVQGDRAASEGSTEAWTYLYNWPVARPAADRLGPVPGEVAARASPRPACGERVEDPPVNSGEKRRQSSYFRARRPISLVGWHRPPTPNHRKITHALHAPISR